MGEKLGIESPEPFCTDIRDIFVFVYQFIYGIFGNIITIFAHKLFARPRCGTDVANPGIQTIRRGPPEYSPGIPLD